MRKIKKLFAGFLLAASLVLGACQNLSDPATVVASVQTGYSAALTAEIGYLASGKADPKVVQDLANARNGVAEVLDPLAAKIAAGQAPTDDEALALQTALAAFQAALKSNGLEPKS